MKTTFELPDALVKEVKILAVHEGKKLKEMAADLLREGLAARKSPPAYSGKSRISTDPETGFPVVICDPDAPASRMSAEELSALEVQSQLEEDLERTGVAL